MEWLLLLSWAGRTWRLATSSLEVDGEQYQAGISTPSLSDDSAPGSATAFRSVALTIYLGDAVDVAELVERGWSLASATATLSRYYPATGRASQEVSGRLVDPTYSQAGAAITCSLEGGPWNQEVTFPTASQKVNTTTHDNPDDGALQRIYPQVYGRPGWLDFGRNSGKGSPGLAISSTRLLIAGHQVQTGTVEIMDETAGGGWVPYSVLTDHDNLGQLYSYCAVTITADHDYYVKWDSGSDALAARTDTRGQPILTARQVLAEFLRRTSVGCDLGRTLSTAGLDQALDFYVDEVVDVWAWIKAHLLPILPISIWSGPEGAYPIVWRYGATSEDVTFSLERGRNASRIGAVEVTSSAIVNEVTINYAVDASSGTYQRSLTLSGDRDLEGHTKKVALLSHGIFGRAARSISSDVIQDDASAFQAACNIIDKQAMPERRVTYAVGEDVILKAGDVVSVTDDELHISGRRGLVEDPQMLSGYNTYRIRLLEG